MVRSNKTLVVGIIGILLSTSAFAEEGQPSRDPKGPTAPASASATIGDPHEGQEGHHAQGKERAALPLTTNAEKATAYDKWTEKQKISVSDAMGRDLGKLSAAERAEAIATMTEQEKSDAYDYYVDHDKKAIKKAN